MGCFFFFHPAVLRPPQRARWLPKMLGGGGSWASSDVSTWRAPPPLQAPGLARQPRHRPSSHRLGTALPGPASPHALGTAFLAPARVSRQNMTPRTRKKKRPLFCPGRKHSWLREPPPPGQVTAGHCHPPGNALGGVHVHPGKEMGWSVGSVGQSLCKKPPRWHLPGGASRW